MNAVQIHKRDEEEAKWGGGFWLCDTSLVNNGSTSAEEISNTRKSAMSSTHKWMSFNDIWWMRSCGMDDVSKAPSSAAAVELLLASFVLSHSKLRMQPTGLQGLAGESLPRGLHFHCGQWPQWGWIQQPKSHWKGIWENFLGFEISLCCGGGGGGALLPNPPPPHPPSPRHFSACIVRKWVSTNVSNLGGRGGGGYCVHVWSCFDRREYLQCFRLIVFAPMFARIETAGMLSW